MVYGHTFTHSSEELHAFHRRCLRQFFKSLATEGGLTENSFQCFYCFKQFDDLTPLFSHEQHERLFLRNQESREQIAFREAAEQAADEAEIREEMQRRSAFLGTLLGVGLGFGLISTTGSHARLIYNIAFRTQLFALGASSIAVGIHPNLEQLENFFQHFIPIRAEDPLQFFALAGIYDLMFLMTQLLGHSIAENYLP